MATRQPNSQEPGQRRPMTPLERFLFMIALAALAFFLLKILGVPVVTQTDKTEIIEHPHR